VALRHFSALARSLPGGHAAVMLILSRKVGQSIVINGNVVVKVVRMDEDQIKLRIDAPKEISVHREEIQRQRGPGWVKSNRSCKSGPCSDAAQWGVHVTASRVAWRAGRDPA